MSKPKPKRRAVKADAVQVGDRIEVRGTAGVVVERETTGSVVSLWWRADDDNPDLSPHRCHLRLDDEDVTLLPEPRARPKGDDHHDAALD